MWFTDWFKFSYRLPQSCAGCSAHLLHIEDLQRLLASEREGYAILLAQVLPANRSQDPSEVKSSEVKSSEVEMKPLRNNMTMGQLRRQAEAKEKLLHPNATSEYWEKVQAEYDKVGKIPGNGGK